MKKLSEIGLEVGPYEDRLNNTEENGRLFTDTELLEAYRIVWEAAQDAMREGVSLPHFTTFEDFIKENGL